MPAKRIIILEKVEGPGLRFRYALWADVPAARQSKYANPTKTSAFADVSASELDDLRAGKFVEQVDSGSWATGIPLGTIQAELQSAWQKFQNEVNAANAWQRYGTFWDGTSWNLAGVT